MTWDDVLKLVRALKDISASGAAVLCVVIIGIVFILYIFVKAMTGGYDKH